MLKRLLSPSAGHLCPVWASKTCMASDLARRPWALLRHHVGVHSTAPRACLDAFGVLPQSTHENPSFRAMSSKAARVHSGGVVAKLHGYSHAWVAGPHHLRWLCVLRFGSWTWGMWYFWCALLSTVSWTCQIYFSAQTAHPAGVSPYARWTQSFSQSKCWDEEEMRGEGCAIC